MAQVNSDRISVVAVPRYEDAANDKRLEPEEPEPGISPHTLSIRLTLISIHTSRKNCYIASAMSISEGYISLTRLN